eukprot:Gb_02480 [translate_table: standard]
MQGEESSEKPMENESQLNLNFIISMMVVEMNELRMVRVMDMCVEDGSEDAKELKVKYEDEEGSDQDIKRKNKGGDDSMEDMVMDDDVGDGDKKAKRAPRELGI